MRELEGAELRWRAGWGLFCFVVVLAVMGTMGGCRRVQGVGLAGRDQEKRVLSPGERLVAYEQDGFIWVVQASGKGARKISRAGNLMLGPWAPNAKKITVLTAAGQSGKWMIGYAGILDLEGKLKPVVAPQGLFAQEPGEIAWLADGETLVLASLDTIWIARDEGDVFKAEVFYTTQRGGNERVWRPRPVPGGKEISFWITTSEGEGANVKARLVTLSEAGGKPQEIFSETIWASGQAPTEALWSPDGKYVLIYAEPAGEGSCWWLLERETCVKTAVLSPMAGDVQWLPGGSSLVYAPQAQLQVPKYEVLDVVAGKTSSFAEFPSWVSWIEVSPEGKKILLAKAVSEDNGFKWDLYIAEADGTGVKELVAGAGDAVWQP